MGFSGDVLGEGEEGEGGVWWLGEEEKGRVVSEGLVVRENDVSEM